MIPFLLNLPYTIVGILAAVVCLPYSVSFHSQPYAIIFKVHKCWWAIGFYKKMRAATTGHVILLTDKMTKNDLEHEIIHVRQYQKYPFIFPILYYYETWKKGYRNNRFEDEAYTVSGSYYHGNSTK